VPAPHLPQEELAGDAENSPAGQGAHEAGEAPPAEGLKVPARQAWHCAAPPVEKVPLSHGAHWVEPFWPAYLPAAQGSQYADDAYPVKEPGAQGAQVALDEARRWGLAVPGGQEEHDSADLPDHVPGPHPAHRKGDTDLSCLYPALHRQPDSAEPGRESEKSGHGRHDGAPCSA